MQIHWPEVSGFNVILLVVFLLMVLTGCEEYQKGCMDADAVNFKVSNQLPCCCEYPRIQFQTVLSDGESTLSFADTFTNRYGQKYTIASLQFIASQISVSDSIGRTYAPSDTLGDYIAPSDVLVADVLQLNSSGANFLKNGNFEKLDFVIREMPELNKFRPSDFPAGHPLRDSTFYSFQQQMWIIAKATLSLDDGSSRSLLVYQSEEHNPVVVSGRWTKVRGENLIVNFKMNVETLFSGMDLTWSTDLLKKEFILKLPVSIEL